jgi:hypothetical protein
VILADAEACEICGRPLPPLKTVVRQERRRVLARRAGRPETPPGASVFAVSTFDRVYRLCPPCAEAVEAGRDPHALVGRRAAWQILLFAAILVLLAAVTPFALPFVMSALFLR